MDQVNAIYNENGMARPQEQPKPTPPVSPGKATASPGKATKAKKAKKKNEEVTPVPSKPKTLEVAVKQVLLRTRLAHTYASRNMSILSICVSEFDIGYFKYLRQK